MTLTAVRVPSGVGGSSPAAAEVSAFRPKPACRWAPPAHLVRCGSPEYRRATIRDVDRAVANPHSVVRAWTK